MYALQALLDRGVICPDVESLEKKRQKTLDRIAEKNSKPTVKFLRPRSDIPSDQQLRTKTHQMLSSKCESAG